MKKSSNTEGKTAEITAHILKSEKIHQRAIELIKKLSGEYGAIVCIARPADTLISELKKKKIPTQKILLINAIGKSTAENVISLSEPSALTELSLVIAQALQSMPKGYKHIIVEGLNGLTFYNSASTVQKFVQFLDSKMRLWKVEAHILTDTNTDASIISLLKQNADKVETD